MANTGDVLHNPALGSRIVFRRTAAETNGELLEFDFYLAPHTYVIAEHAHPRGEERTQVVAGELRGVGGGQSRHLLPGESIVVPRGMFHFWGNDSEQESHWIVQFRPAAKMEYFLEAVWNIAAAGEAGADGFPKKLLQRVVIASEFRNEMRPSMPWLKWKLGTHVLAPIGRLLGYSAYPPRVAGPSATDAHA